MSLSSSQARQSTSWAGDPADGQLVPRAGATVGLPAAGGSLLRAYVEYGPDGVLLFRLAGHEANRFARVLQAFRDTVGATDREWCPESDAWLLFGGWDEELLELLEDYFEPHEIFINGRPLPDAESE